MAHGAPDDSDIVKNYTHYRIDDMAELAVRLGSPVGYQRYGEVVWYEDFSCGVGSWLLSSPLADAEFSACNDHYLSAGVGGKLCYKTGTGFHSSISRVSGYESGTRIGFAGYYLIDSLVTKFSIFLYYYHAGLISSPEIFIDHTTGEIKYNVQDIGYVLLTTVPPFDNTGNVWYPFKMVIDTDIDQYVRFSFGNKTYDMAEAPIPTTMSPTSDRCVAMIMFYSKLNQGYDVYLDNLVFTVNEF